MKRYSVTLHPVTGAMLTALSIILPQIFHLTGIPQVGAVFLPMHIPVLLAGFILGPVYGSVIGAITPVISFLITNMPTAERLPFMVAELIFYGLSSGLFYHKLGFKSKKFGTVITLCISMVIGRVVCAALLFVMSELFKINCPSPALVITATVTGIYGIVLQLVTVPPIVYALKRSNFIK